MTRPAAFIAIAITAVLSIGSTDAAPVAPPAAVPAASAGHPSEKRPFQLPPSAELDYAIKAQQSGLTLDGSGHLSWQAGNDSFSIASETRAMLVGKILEAKTEGSIDAFGLAPTSFTDKRLRKEATVTTFDRSAQVIRFSASGETYPIKGGEQDRNSVVWQLIGNARGAPKKFTAGSEWRYFVAGQRDAEAWTFKVGKVEKIQTPVGHFSAVHVVKIQPPGTSGQQLDIWLAPVLNWYPVRLRVTEPDGDYVEQTLSAVGKK